LHNRAFAKRFAIGQQERSGRAPSAASFATAPGDSHRHGDDAIISLNSRRVQGSRFKGTQLVKRLGVSGPPYACERSPEPLARARGLVGNLSSPHPGSRAPSVSQRCAGTSLASASHSRSHRRVTASRTGVSTPTWRRVECRQIPRRARRQKSQRSSCCTIAPHSNRGIQSHNLSTGA